MIHKLFLVACLTIPGLTINAQFFRNFDLGVSYGRIKSTNKAEIQSERISGGFQSSDLQIDSESPLWAYTDAVSLGYTISRSQLRLIYMRGAVGSILTGSSTTRDDVGFTFFNTFDRSRNVIKYSSIGVSYAYRLPIGEDYIGLSVGASRQQNSFRETLVIIEGILFVNYNISASLSFEYNIIEHLDLVPRLIVINSLSNSRSSMATSKSRFIPLQTGYEIGIRFRY